MTRQPVGAVVWLDGHLVACDAAAVSVYDRAFRSGEGVLETVRVAEGRPVRLAAHLARAVAGARELGVTLDAEELRRGAHALLDASAAGPDPTPPDVPDADDPTPPRGDLVLRLTASAGAVDPASPFPGLPVGPPTVVWTLHAARPPDELLARGLTAVTVAWTRPLPAVKSVSALASTAALRHAQVHGADTALLVDGDGRVTEAATANLLVVEQDTLVTPPLGPGGPLPGITRAAVLALAPGEGLTVSEEPVSVARLVGADEALVTSAIAGVLPLVAVDGTPIGNGRPGAWTRLLRDAERRDAAGSGHDDPAATRPTP